MKVMILFALFNLSVAFGSSKIKCDFTEPFVTFIVDLENNALTQESYLVANESVFVRLELKGHKLNVYSEESGEKLLQVIADIGDDGMSDLLYPLKAIWGSHHGGCSIGKHQPIGAMNAFEDIINIFNNKRRR